MRYTCIYLDENLYLYTNKYLKQLESTLSEKYSRNNWFPQNSVQFNIYSYVEFSDTCVGNSKENVQTGLFLNEKKVRMRVRCVCTPLSWKI